MPDRDVGQGSWAHLGLRFILPGILPLLVMCGPVAGQTASPTVVVTLTPVEGRPEKLAGRVVVEDQQGGVLLEDAVGQYWTLESREIVSRMAGDAAFLRAGTKDLAENLKAAAGGPAVIVETKHYVIVSRASRAYANWCGSLLERLRNGFLAYWDREGIELEPGAPHLPVLILQNKGQFREYAVRDGASAAAETAGYYSARTNRIVLYDLTADLGGRPLGEATQREEITRRLSKSPGSVATVVHEAVHQLSFNSGLQTRYADNPMWASEGLAMYFETPDLGAGTRWTTAGKVSVWRLEEFRGSLTKRPTNSFISLIEGEERFRAPEQMTGAYAESWVLVHFLATKKRAKWAEYLGVLRAKPPLIFQTPEERLAEFRSVFGDDLAALEREMVQHAADLRRR
ncbi:DUF1570 domain-containing protein [Caulifigura coniformis]|uniref:DUF1570 domain-containing protein n=1 Tax=Caulifigura coniformis TaxID=2527983 RepID=UPI0011A0A4E9|nr:DUF1570 domain-containing protein [Caulifigura coniformis]